jgi:hypothetical protein
MDEHILYISSFTDVVGRREKILDIKIEDGHQQKRGG